MKALTFFGMFAAHMTPEISRRQHVNMSVAHPCVESVKPSVGWSRRWKRTNHEADKACVGASNGEEHAGDAQALQTVRAPARVRCAAHLVVHRARRPSPHVGVWLDDRDGGGHCRVDNRPHNRQFDRSKPVSWVPGCLQDLSAALWFTVPDRRMAEWQHAKRLC
eukprot:2910771-Pyramimonas_sp.AAC.1